MPIIFNNENTLWNKLFEELQVWWKLEAFDYNIVADCIRFVDDVSEIDPYEAGLYIIRDNGEVYDQSSTLISTYVYKDRFKVDDIDYFVSEFGSINELGTKWNNTQLGQYGISIFKGEQTDVSTFQSPSIFLIQRGLKSINMLESRFVTGIKQWSFDIGIMVEERDLFDPTEIGYSNFALVESKVTESIRKFFNECPNVQTFFPRVTEWEYDSEILSEDRPLVIGRLINKITYR